jgi:hypothetical protein
MGARRLVFAMLVSVCVLVGGFAFGGVAARAAFEHHYLSQLTEVPASSGVPVTGPFAHPWGLTFDSSGDLYVADNGSSVVDEFDSAGSFVSQLGNGLLDGFGRSVAVNDASGEVYVADSGPVAVDAFSSAGAHLETWSGADTPSGSFGRGYVHVAVDNSTSLSDPAAGDVYVADSQHGVVDVFRPEAGGKEKYLTQFTGASTPNGSFGQAFDIAIDETNGDVLVVDKSSAVVDVFAPVLGGYEYQTRLTGPPGGSFGEINGVAVEGSTGDVYVSDTTARSVYQFTGAGAFVTQITGTPTSAFGEPLGVAVAANGDVYVSEGSAKALDVFGPTVLVPDVVTTGVENVQNTSATLTGTVNPLGLATTYQFEYGTGSSYGTSIPVPPGNADSGTEPVPVSASVTGLTPDTTYHYRLTATTANGVSYGQDLTFTTTSPPLLSNEFAGKIATNSVVLNATINPKGVATTYHFEYGQSTAYGTNIPVPDGSIGAGSNDVSVNALVSGVAPGTVYHFRIVATSEAGSTAGPDSIFRTLQPSASGLPDGRVYEAVSPVSSEGNANIYVPSAGFEYFTIFGEHGIWTNRPFEVAGSGDAVVYLGDPQPAGGGSGGSGVGHGEQYLATRYPGGGWSQADIQPSTGNSAYLGFTEDLSLGVFSADRPLAVNAPQGGLYVHLTSGGSYRSLSTKPIGYETLYAGANSGTSGVPAMSHVLLGAKTDLLEGQGAFEKEFETIVASMVEEGRRVRALYDFAGVGTGLVSVLPDGKPDADASFGAPVESEQNESVSGPGLSHVVSADGSRIFWTDRGSGDLYVRENQGSSDARTVQVDASVGGGGHFWTASADGSRVFFTKGDLYEYDVSSGRTVDLTPGVEVLGLAGSSEDAKYIYYVDSNYRLVLLHDSVSTPVTTLSAAEADNVPPYDGLAEYHFSGDWQAAVGFRTTAITPDGHSLVFMSDRSLTGYSNNGLEEVFDYETGSGELRCVSCNPSGEPPIPTEIETQKGGSAPLGAFIPITKRPDAVAPPRVISADGSRVFFDSAEPLVPQDTNGWLDVYEWERTGAGGCRETGGCVYLLSDGSDPESSYLLGVSDSGNDAFIITRAQAVAWDRNDLDDVYDARVGGVQPPAASVCSGAGCQGVPPAPPIFATPSSVTFSGVGNFPSETGHGGSQGRSLTRAQKLERALRACRAVRNKHRRVVCRARARKRYGAGLKATRGNGRGK